MTTHADEPRVRGSAQRRVITALSVCCAVLLIVTIWALANRNQYTAKLSKNETASLCFRDAGELKFVVRAESSQPSGEQNLAGTVTISSEAIARPSIEKEGAGHTAQSPYEEPASNR